MEIYTPASTLILRPYALKATLLVCILPRILIHSNFFFIIKAKNYTTPATKTETFDKLPRMLNFHLQRVYYDLQRKEAVKLNNQFAFDKVIYLDRYMHRNERETTRRREHIVTLEGHVKEMEAEIDRYEGKINCGLSMLDQMDNVAEFIRTFIHHKMDNIEEVCGSVASLRDQVSNRIQGISSSSLSFSLKLIMPLELRTQIAKKKKEIANAFADMRQCEYRLHAVLVHDGRAGSGHYWYVYFLVYI